MENANKQNDEISNLIKELEPTIRTLKKMQDSGFLGAIDALLDHSDELFNYLVNMENMGTLSLLWEIIPILNELSYKVDFDKLKAALSKENVKKVNDLLINLLDFLGNDIDNIKINKSRANILEVLSQMRSSEIEYLFEVMQMFTSKYLQNKKDN